MIDEFTSALHRTTTVLSTGEADFVYVERRKERIVSGAPALVTHNSIYNQTWVWALGRRGFDRIAPEHLMAYRPT